MELFDAGGGRVADFDGVIEDFCMLEGVLDRVFDGGGAGGRDADAF